MTKPIQRRVSASRLNSLADCTMKFFLNEYLRLPEKVWPRTVAGTISHSVLEALARDRHHYHYDLVKEKGTIYASPAIARLVRTWKEKENISDVIIADIDEMCMVAINKTDFLDTEAEERFDPEHEFKFTLSNGGVVKGFIDRLARHKDRFVIWDYKTARDKFTKNDVAESFQSAVYQLYVWKKFQMPAEVRYVFLRHPPTPRAPQKHIMVTPPATSFQHEGFEGYLEYMHELINAFDENKAATHYHDDEGFCERVCSYRRPFQYLHVEKPSGELVGNYFLDLAPQVKDDEVSSIQTFKGCKRWNY